MKSMIVLFLAISLSVSRWEPLAEEISAFEATNDYRMKKHRDSLVLDTFLCRLAREHSTNMANGKVRFGHAGFSGRSKEINERYGNSGSAENVYWADHKASGEDAVISWINSKGHRKNMLEKRYHKVGIGVAYDSEGASYYTQIFCD